MRKFFTPCFEDIFNPNNNASYSAMLLVHIKVKVKENLNVYLFGETNATPTPTPSFELAPSKYIVQTLLPCEHWAS